MFSDFLKQIRNNRKQTAFIFGVSFAASILLLGIFILLVFIFRGEIFNQFGRTYLNNLNQVSGLGSGEAGRNLLTEESIIVDIVDRVNPSVVSITVSRDVPTYERYYEELRPFGSPYTLRIPRLREDGTERRETGGGSGFIVSSSGLIITNKHVVDDDDAFYTVFTNNGREYDAKIVATDPFYDIAVLQIESEESFPYLELGDADSLMLGQTVIAIGNALGEFRNSVSVGVVSGLLRSVAAADSSGEIEQLEEVIQTDAGINPGNSGGPLLDLRGRVVGVNVAVALGSENIGFALPIDIVREVLESIEDYGDIIRPYLGVHYLQIDKELQEENNLVSDHGALIIGSGDNDMSGIVPDSPAERAGLRENDIILEVDGEVLDGARTLGTIIRDKRVGDTVELTIMRNGQRMKIGVRLEAAPTTN